MDVTEQGGGETERRSEDFVASVTNYLDRATIAFGLLLMLLLIPRDLQLGSEAKGRVNLRRGA